MQPISVPTIPLNDAIARVTLFREQMVKSEAVPESNIPRAILIPINDLMAIVEKYSTINEDGTITSSLKGVRAYFAIKATDMDLPDDVTALIVPVDLKGDDIITTPASSIGIGLETEIYDFTVPCPTECDTDSPLYIP